MSNLKPKFYPCHNIQVYSISISIILLKQWFFKFIFQLKVIPLPSKNARYIQEYYGPAIDFDSLRIYGTNKSCKLPVPWSIKFPSFCNLVRDMDQHWRGSSPLSFTSTPHLINSLYSVPFWNEQSFHMLFRSVVGLWCI